MSVENRDWRMGYESGKRELEARLAQAEADRDRLREAVHQWLGAYAAGYFDNIARTRRETTREIVKTSEAALAGDKQT